MKENLTREQVAAMIDHTLLKQDASAGQIRKLCAEAKEYRFASVCVNPCYVPLCAAELAGSGVKVCTVIGFPLGASTGQNKAREAAEAAASGADELDMVINVGMMKSGDYDGVYEDIAGVVRAAEEASDGEMRRILVKVIIETCLLTEEEKIRACLIAKKAGADFVKTSTGFSTGGATTEDVELMRRTVGPGMGIKAAGGIRTAEDAAKMIKAGADRIGASAGIAILEGWDA